MPVKYMTEDISSIDSILNSLDEILDTLILDDSLEGFKKYSTILEPMDYIYNKLLKIIPELEKQSIVISKDVVLCQLENLLDALEHKDALMFADTLEYEVKETL